MFCVRRPACQQRAWLADGMPGSPGGLTLPGELAETALSCLAL